MILKICFGACWCCAVLLCFLKNFDVGFFPFSLLWKPDPLADPRIINKVPIAWGVTKRTAQRQRICAKRRRAAPALEFLDILGRKPFRLLNEIARQIVEMTFRVGLLVLVFANAYEKENPQGGKTAKACGPNDPKLPCHVGVRVVENLKVCRARAYVCACGCVCV